MEINLHREGTAAKGHKADKARKTAKAELGARQIITCMRQFRQRAGLTMAELGEKLNLSEAAVSRMERGLSEPGILTALRVADILDVSVRELWPSQIVKRVHQTDAVSLM